MNWLHSAFFCVQVALSVIALRTLMDARRMKREAREAKKEALLVLAADKSLLDQVNLQQVSRAVFAHYAPPHLKTKTPDEGTN